MQGHFASELIPDRVLYPYGLFCDNRLDAGKADSFPVFYFSNQSELLFTDPVLGDVFGSGRVSFSNDPGVVDFRGEAHLGFAGGDCRVIPAGDDCVFDVCVLRLSNPAQGSVASCDDDSLSYSKHSATCAPCVVTQIFLHPSDFS